MNFEECGCDCHRINNMKHITACCGICPICGKNIKCEVYDKHVENHNSSGDKLKKYISTSLKLEINNREFNDKENKWEK